MSSRAAWAALSASPRHPPPPVRLTCECSDAMKKRGGAWSEDKKDWRRFDSAARQSALGVEELLPILFFF